MSREPNTPLDATTSKIMGLVEQLCLVHEEIGANQNGTHKSWRLKELIQKELVALQGGIQLPDDMGYKSIKQGGPVGELSMGAES